MIVSATTRYKSWQVRVKIDGQSYRATGMPSRSLGVDQPRSSCSIELKEIVSTSLAGKPIQIDIACNSKWRRFFTGYVAPDSVSVAGINRTVNVVDILYKLNRVLGGEDGIIWNNVAWPDAIREILNAGGIGDGDIAGIYDPGSVYNLGSVQEEIIEPRESLQQVAADLLAFAGAAMFVLPSGKVQIIPASRVPSSSSSLCYSSTPGSGDYRLFGSRRSIGLFEDLISSITASGPAVDLGVAPEATYTLSGLVGQADSFSNRFIQSIVPQAETIAERECRQRARLERTIDLEVPLDPDVLPGQTLLYQVPEVGYSARTPGYIVAVRTSGTAMTITASFGPSQSDGFSSILDPIPDFTAKVVKETVNGTDVCEIFLDGSTSLSQNAADIISWAWTCSGTLYTTSPAQSSTSGTQTRATWCFVVTDTTTVDITLTVSDGLKTGTITRTIDLSAASTDGPPLTRALAIAFGAGFAVTANGGKTWVVEVDDGDAVAVPPMGAGVDDRAPITASGLYGAIATRGSSGGSGLRETKDFLQTHSVPTWAGAGVIRCLWRNEAAPGRVWAGIGQKVYRSIDGGQTFVEWGTPLSGQNVNWIIEDPVVLNSVFVLAGNKLQHSTASAPPGSSWATLYTGPTGAVARQMVRGRDGAHTWIAFTGTFTGSPLHRVEGGISVTFPVVSPTVSEIRALALLETDTGPQLVAFDSATSPRIWLANGEDGTVGASGRTLPSGEEVQHALADPDVPIVYVATFGPTEGWARKYLFGGDMLLDFYQGATGQQAHMIGLVKKGTSVKATLLRLPNGGSGASDKLFIYQDTVWSTKDLPEAGITEWRSIQANPLNGNELLLFRWGGSGNRLWYSNNFGDTWTSVFQDLPSRSDQSIPIPQWSWSTSGNWALTAHGVDGGDRTRVLRGFRATYTMVIDDPAGLYDRYGIGAGLDDDLAVINVNGLFYLLPASNVITAAGSGSAGFGDFMLAGRATHRMAKSGSLGGGPGCSVSTDYRSAPWTGLSGVGGYSVAALDDGTVYVGGRNDGGRDGVMEVLNAFASPSTSVVAGSGEGTGHIASDKQSQTIVACPVGNGSMGFPDTLVRDANGSWGRVNAPPGSANLADWVEVVNLEVS